MSTLIRTCSPAVRERHPQIGMSARLCESEYATNLGWLSAG